MGIAFTGFTSIIESTGLLQYTQELLPFVQDSSSIGHIATIPHSPLDDVIAEAKSSPTGGFHTLTAFEYAALGKYLGLHFSIIFYDYCYYYLCYCGHYFSLLVSLFIMTN